MIIAAENGEQFTCDISFSDGSSTTASGEVANADEGEFEFTIN